MLTIPPLITETERELLQNLIANAKRILICGHRGPDGDAVGSALGWADYLKRLGKETVVMMMNRVRDVKAMPGYKLDIVFRDGVHGIFDCNPYRDYECLPRCRTDTRNRDTDCSPKCHERHRERQYRIYSPASPSHP